MKRGVLLLALIVLSTSANAQTPRMPTAPTTPTTRSQTTATAAGVAARMQAQGYSDIHDLHRGPDGKWVGQATRNGAAVTVTAEPEGGLTAR
jgi:glucose/arabinose dehydrogenase